MNRQEIEKTLKDYAWMINSIKILREALNGAGERVVREYGPDSDMPKPKGGISDPVYREYLRREKRWAKVKQYEDKVRVIQERMHVIQDEREIEVLHWLLEGKSYCWIAMHMGFSPSHIKRIRDAIVDKLAADETNGTDGTKETNFADGKSAC